MSLTIYIPSRGRWDKVVTYKQIPHQLKKDTLFVVYPEEYENYTNIFGESSVIKTNFAKSNIGEKRQWIVEKCPTRYCIMLDDDLVFSQRREKGHSKMSPDETYDMIKLLYQKLLNGFVHVGISPQQINFSTEEEFQENTRIYAVLGYDLEVLRKENIDFKRCQPQEDYDTNLTLLEKGYPNWVSFKYMFSQKAGAQGGCSDYRTKETMSKVSYTLAKLHPGLVDVVLKETNWDTIKEERVDVRINWKKAFNFNKKKGNILG